MRIFVDFDKTFCFSRKIPEFHISYHLEIWMENYCRRCWLQSTTKIIHFRQYLWIMKKNNIALDIQKNKHIELGNKQTWKNLEKKMICNEIRNCHWIKKTKLIYRARRNWINRLQAEDPNWFPNCRKKQRSQRVTQNQLSSHLKISIHKYWSSSSQTKWKMYNLHIDISLKQIAIEREIVFGNFSMEKKIQ